MSKRARSDGGAKKAKSVKKKTKSSTSGYTTVQVVKQPTFRQPERGFVGARGDYKWVDVAAATYACNTTGSVTHLSIIGQGATVNTREGKACRATSVQIRGRFTVDSATTVTSVAAYLVWDYDPKKNLAGLTDILASASPYSFPSRENANRFKVVKKWNYVMAGTSGAPTTGLEIIGVDDYVKLPAGANILYTAIDTTGVIGDVIQGALLLVTVGDQAAGTTDANLTVGARVNFTDQLT